MQKNKNPAVERTVAIETFFKIYRIPIIISASVILLQLIFGLIQSFVLLSLAVFISNEKDESFSALHRQ